MTRLYSLGVLSQSHPLNYRTTFFTNFHVTSPTALKSDELEIDASLSSGSQVRTKFQMKYHENECETKWTLKNFRTSLASDK